MILREWILLKHNTSQKTNNNKEIFNIIYRSYFTFIMNIFIMNLFIYYDSKRMDFLKHNTSQKTNNNKEIFNIIYRNYI